MPEENPLVMVLMRADVWSRLRSLPLTDDQGETTPVYDNVRSVNYLSAEEMKDV